MLALLLMITAAVASWNHLDDGDRHWANGDRASAAMHWHAASKDTTPAIVAMAEMRLLLVSGNLGMLIHGPRADAALATCPTTDPLCALAWCDYHIILALLGLPHDPDHAKTLARQARPHLTGRAVARQVLLGEATLADLQAATDRGGLAEGLLEHGGWVRGPGTWFVGIGGSGAPGLGVGGGLTVVHPDLAWRAWNLQVNASISTIGNRHVHTALRSPDATFVNLNATAQRLVFVSSDPKTVGLVDIVTGLGHRFSSHSIWAGPLLRWDNQQPGHGVRLGWQGQYNAIAARVDSEVALVGAQHHKNTAALTWHGNRWALHGTAMESIGSQAPWWRQPFAGGGHILRSAPAYRWQAPWLTAAAVEFRQPIVGPLGGVVFAETAWANGTHWGIGSGIRLWLPPQPLNTVRLDVAWSPEGVTVTAGWGEAF